MIKALHGIRGLAAVVVFFYHYLPLLPGLGDEAFPGDHAVDVFFCLSGFILTRVYFDRLVAQRPRWGEYKKFLQNRFARVVPLATVTTLVFICIVCVARAMKYPLRGAIDLSWVQVIGNLLFLDRTLMLITTLHVPKWAVSNEVWAYVLIFPTFYFIRRISSVAVRVAFCGGLVGVQVLAYDWLDQCLGPFFARCIPEFVLGFFVYQFLQVSGTRGTTWTGVWSTAVFIIGVVTFCTGTARLQGIAGMMIVLGAAHKDLFIPIAKFLGCRLCFWLGEISYSLYLWHTLVQAVVAPVRQAVPFIANHYWLFFLIVVVPATFAVAHCSYRFLECPLRDFLRASPRQSPIPTTGFAITREAMSPSLKLKSS